MYILVLLETKEFIKKKTIRKCVFSIELVKFWRRNYNNIKFKKYAYKYLLKNKNNNNNRFIHWYVDDC